MPDTPTTGPMPLGVGRQALALAVPAFLALVAEPAFLLADAAVVGRLGTSALAGLGVASGVLAAAAGVFVFLAYGTTSTVSRRLGSGDRRAALAAGMDGVWLGLLCGVLTGLLLLLSAGPLAALFGASGAATDQATTYLRVSAAGLPGMLTVLATTGVLRGLQDTRTPLLVSVVGFTLNIAFNVLLVLVLHQGIAGSAAGTVLAQTLMAAALLAVVVRGARRHRSPLRPHPWRVLAAARDGVPLLVRTLALRAVLLLTTWAAAASGDVTLAAYQVSSTIWVLLAFALDALAIAAQAMTGFALGAGDVIRARALTSLLTRWGVLSGVVLGLLVLLAHRALPAVFTPVPAVRTAIAAALVVVAVQQWLCGLVFVLDGVLIGAGDGRWLARAAVGQLLAYLPIVLWLHRADHGVVALWWGFGAFMLVRGALLTWRARGGRWAVPGT